MTGLDDVLRRWNPHGRRRLHAPPSATVRVAGVAGAGCSTLIAELEALGDDTRPGLDYVRDGDGAVVLFVTDASAVLGRTELAELDRAARSAVAVVCALTAVDLRPDRHTIRDRDADVLHRHLPWLGSVDVLPVSAADAARARRLGGDVGRVLAVESGIVDVHEALRAAVAATANPRVVRAAVLARTRAMILEEIDALRTSDDTGDLRAERLRLSTARGSAPVTAHRVTHARTEILQDVAVQLRAVSTRMSELLDGGAAAPTEIPDRLAAELRDVAAAVAAEVSQRWGPAADADLDVLPGAAAVPDLPDPPAPTGTVEDRVTFVLGVSAGAGLGKLLSTSMGWLPTVPAFVLTVGCGVVAAWWLVRLRRQLAHRDRVRRWVTDEITAFRGVLDAWVRARAFDAEERFGRAADTRGRERAVELVDRIADIDEEIRRRVGTRRARIEACERDLAMLDRRTEPIGRALRPTVDGTARAGKGRA